MGKLRFLFALWMAKLSVPALKITRHNGTDSFAIHSANRNRSLPIVFKPPW